MSWAEQIKENIKIVTGDGKSYSPLYVISSEKIEFNISKFDFPDINGTLVKRTTSMGASFPLEISFEGDDHLDLSDQFRESSRDNRPWTIYHPIYGVKLVQPGSLEFDSSGLSSTVITGDYYETIEDDYPSSLKNALDEVSVLSDQASVLIVDDFSNSVDVDTSVTTQLNGSTSDGYNLGASAIKSGSQANEYYSLFTEANSAILTGISEPSKMAQKVINLTEYPSKFNDSVLNRLNLLKNQFNKLSINLDSIISPKNKKTYEYSALGLMNTIIKTVVNPLDGNYTNSVSVFNVINQVLNIHNSIISNLDYLQTNNNGSSNSYAPNYSSVNAVFSLVNYAVSNLYNIALNAKQERKLILENDSNVITLAHRFYGLDPDDSTIENFISINSIGLNEYFEVKKGRNLMYFV
jgi:hypothetical protein